MHNTLFNLTTIELHDMLKYVIKKEQENFRKSQDQYLIIREILLDSLYDDNESV